GPAKIEALGRELRCICHSFSQSSPPDGVRAELVYAGAGRATDYAGLAVRGKIVLLDGIANPAASLEASKRGAAGQLHISPHEYLHEMCISPVWGSPHDEQLDRLPKTVVVTTAKEDGDKLKAALAQGAVTVTLFAQVDTGWRKTPILIADLPGADTDKYVLLSGHYDSWYLGAMDNGGANATMLEVARLCAEQRGLWQRGLKLAFWSGHSQGRYSSSTWWADQFYEEIRANCVVHVNVDSTGGLGNTVVADTTAAAELQELARTVIRERAGQEFSGRRNQRAGDQSFWGIGVTSIYGNMSEQPATAGGANAMAAVFGGGNRAGRGTGWWWHTPHDTYDKLEESILVRDTAIYVSTVWRLLTGPVLPLRYEACAAEISQALAGLRKAAGEKFDLGYLAERASLLEEQCTKLSALAQGLGPGGKADLLNACLVDLSRILVPICFNVAGPYEQDPALGFGPLPGLAPVAAMGALDPDSDAFLHLHVRMMRHRNRVAVALSEANRRAEQALIQLQQA
ncbi:MAG: Peptidase, family, partial [Firmicutes bacterium]|nr:Peptidase, family [Bacillota bacterium]